jgi:hypothetical protein
MNRNGYGVLGNFNPEIENKVKQIKEEIEKEKQSDTANKERIQKLAQEIMVQGLKLNVGYTRNYGQLGGF